MMPLFGRAKAPLAGTSHDLIRWPWTTLRTRRACPPCRPSVQGPKLPVLPCQETSNSCTPIWAPGRAFTSFHIRAWTNKRSQVYQIDWDNQTTSQTFGATAFRRSMLPLPKVGKGCKYIMRYAGG